MCRMCSRDFSSTPAPSLASAPPLFAPLPQPPQLDLPAGAFDVRRIGPDLGQHRLLADRPRPDPVVVFGHPPVYDPIDGGVLHVLRDPHAAAEAGGLAALEEGRCASAVLRLSGGGPGVERASRTR